MCVLLIGLSVCNSINRKIVEGHAVALQLQDCNKTKEKLFILYKATKGNKLLSPGLM